MPTDRPGERAATPDETSLSRADTPAQPPAPPDTSDKCPRCDGTGIYRAGYHGLKCSLCSGTGLMSVAVTGGDVEPDTPAQPPAPGPETPERTVRESILAAIRSTSSSIHDSQLWDQDDYADGGKTLMDRLIDRIIEVTLPPPPPADDLARLKIQADLIGSLERGVYGKLNPGEHDLQPDWVYEARAAIKHQNEKLPWLPDLLKILGWQGGTVHQALNAVSRLVHAKGPPPPADTTNYSAKLNSSTPDTPAMSDSVRTNPPADDAVRLAERGGDRPRVVCLCGSTRFLGAYAAANESETLAGRIVLSVGCFRRTAPDGQRATMEEAVKVELDELHKRKIDLADEILVLNVGGYIGSSTKSEIAYAEKHGKGVRWLEPPARPTPEGD